MPVVPARPRWVLFVVGGVVAVVSLLGGAAVGVWAEAAFGPAPEAEVRPRRVLVTKPRAPQIEGIDLAIATRLGRTEENASGSPGAPFETDARLEGGPSSRNVAVATPRDDDEGFRARMNGAHLRLRAGRETLVAATPSSTAPTQDDRMLWARRLSSEPSRPDVASPDLDRTLRTGDLRGDPPAAAAAEMDASTTPIFREDLGSQMEPFDGAARVATPNTIENGIGGDLE